ncbi:YitT family protein [Paenibacillus sp. J2TS4]|uniref:YitT family protein n=1 Tax=Paenibacillus sp. J2TS4 TaxID=2807194 RepID=UPI001B230F9C|nr:YitT family protein [Paenibacillus sp. J2TS4]GIP32416.1 membrane protein [Paenibacillus sp. J2TS4]
MMKFSLPYRNLFPIMLGTAVYAFGLHYFVIPNELMEGGMTGVSLLINYALGIPPSITTLILNVPLFLIGWKIFGNQAMALTVLGTLFLSLFLWIMELLIGSGWIVPLAGHDYFLVTLYAGVTLGTGLGIVFRYGGTTGGSDILARIINKNKGWSMGQIILAIDVLVIGSSLLYIPKEKVLYTIVVVFIASKMIDFITEGAYAAKAFTIVTENAKPLADAITRELERGVTIFPAKGAYSQNNKEVLYCVIARQEARRLRMIIKMVAPSAFIIVTDVHDVLGEGFKEEE